MHAEVPGAPGNLLAELQKAGGSPADRPLARSGGRAKMRVDTARQVKASVRGRRDVERKFYASHVGEFRPNARVGPQASS